MEDLEEWTDQSFMYVWSTDQTHAEDRTHRWDPLGAEGKAD